MPPAPTLAQLIAGPMGRWLRHGSDRVKAALLLVALALVGAAALPMPTGTETDRQSGSSASSIGRVPSGIASLSLAPVVTADEGARPDNSHGGDGHPARIALAADPVVLSLPPRMLVLAGREVQPSARPVHQGPRQPTGPPFRFS